MEKGRMIIGDKVRKVGGCFPMVGTAIAFGRRGGHDTCFVAWDVAGTWLPDRRWEREVDLEVIETFGKSMV